MRRRGNEENINSIFAGILEWKNETRKGRSTHNKKGKYYIMEKEENKVLNHHRFIEIVSPSSERERGENMK